MWGNRKKNYFFVLDLWIRQFAEWTISVRTPCIDVIEIYFHVCLSLYTVKKQATKIDYKEVVGKVCQRLASLLTAVQTGHVDIIDNGSTIKLFIKTVSSKRVTTTNSRQSNNSRQTDKENNLLRMVGKPRQYKKMSYVRQRKPNKLSGLAGVEFLPNSVE